MPNLYFQPFRRLARRRRFRYIQRLYHLRPRLPTSAPLTLITAPHPTTALAPVIIPQRASTAHFTDSRRGSTVIELHNFCIFFLDTVLVCRRLQALLDIYIYDIPYELHNYPAFYPKLRQPRAYAEDECTSKTPNTILDHNGAIRSRSSSRRR